MRVPLVVCSLAALLLSAGPVAAQDEAGEPGCAQSNPCEVILEVDANGIADLAPDRFGTGDWILFSVYNADDETHTVRLSGHDLEFSIEAGDIDDTQPFKLGAPGTYDLKDLPSGDTATITVEDSEVFGDGSSGSTSKSGNPIPALAPSLLVVALAAALLVARRR